ncbi:DUF2857 domain-containing protein [Scandinavium sp. M-37]|uniref:DUF2857 domain-containing protein n=1 Tax=Scandinavium sp. M-37 TaxID=3373077 RepID=UPI003745E551
MSQSLNYAILNDALNALKEGNLRRCEALGFTFNEIEAIRRLSVDELTVLSDTTTGFVDVSVQHDVLSRMLARAGQKVLEDQRITRAVNLGGSIELLGHFFGLSSGEVSIRRRICGTQIPQGRTRIPDEETDKQIWLEWMSRRPDNLMSVDALDAMMDITETLSSMTRNGALSLTVVWNRIMACEKDISEGEQLHQ